MPTKKTAQRPAPKKKAPAKKNGSPAKRPVKDVRKSLAEMSLVGEDRTERLDLVRPNDWNPNQLSGPKYEAVRLSMQHDGWLKSEALLIWGSDQKGKVKNIIINGEHRWEIGQALGYTEGPMVFLHGITREKAIELTIKLDHNRGDFEKLALVAALNQIMPVLESHNPAALLGYEESDLMKLLATPPTDLTGNQGEERAPTNPGIGGVVSENAVSKMVPLYMDEATHTKFLAQVKTIGEHLNLENVTDVVRHCVEEFASTLTDES